jgi:hypothetical protein
MPKKHERNKPEHEINTKQGTAIVVLIIVVAASISLYAWYYYSQNGTGNDVFFNNGGRYDASVLDDMGVVYTNRSDIHAFNEGYSASVNCPWGTIHNGIDYFLNISSLVIAAAPGYIISVQSKDWGPQENEFRFSISIRFNTSIVLTYGFEPWTNTSTLLTVAMALILVKAGDWVVKGQLLGLFAAYSGSAHIHFGVLVNGNAVCPKGFFSVSDLADLMVLIHSYHPLWNLCYS